MPPFSKKRTYKKRKGGTRKARGSTKPHVSFAVKKYVKSKIHNQIENKMITTYASNNSVTGPQFILPLAPLVSQGQGSSGRIGNKINLLSANLSFVLNLNPYNLTTNPYASPVMFRWMLITQRNSNSGVLSLSNFFEVNNSSVSIQGNHLDLLLKVNPELFQVHKQGQFRLGASSNSTTFPASSAVAMEASKFSIQKRIYIHKYLHKRICYDDTVVTPTNTNLWFLLFPVYANGSTNSAYVNANISYVFTHTYEDA